MSESYEIMAPAGSWDCLSAAIAAGADSVYFGVGSLNMRSRSSVNFRAEELPEIVRTCREAGVRSYLAINTIMYDEDLPAAREAIDLACEAGVSAVIASDAAVMQYARQRGMEVHLSTQLNISNVEALRFYSQFADVAVLARELTLEQVRHIYEKVESENICGPSGNKVKIEMFCHGALCMAVSGKCYLSLHDRWRSANRGECLQICRRSYRLTDIETGNEIEVDNKYLMSPKDLKTIHFINKMADAGVRVFKIEGRARGADYVSCTVGCYKEALRAYAEGSFSDERVAEWDRRLATVFNRGFWDGYYMGQRLGEWSSHYGSQATERKTYIGKVGNYFKKIGVAELRLETGTLSKGERLLFTGATTGALYADVSELRNDDGEEVEIVNRGELFAVKVPSEVKRGDKVFKITKSSINEE